MTSAEAKADFKRQINEVQKKFRERALLVKDNKTVAVANACNMVEKNIKLAIHDSHAEWEYDNPVTGNHVKNYDVKRSVPGSAPFPQSGSQGFLGSITHDISENNGMVTGRVGSVITNPPYPMWLEDGTTKMAPRPWLLPSLDKARDAIERMFFRTLGTQAIQIEVDS
jgi:hypothetical protein